MGSACVKRNIAIIPARSGSKGLKDKNIKLCNGKPLMVYTIEAAQRSGIFHTIHLSTDSEYYAEIGKNYGIDVPFLRSSESSSDKASSWDVVLEVLKQYEKREQSFDIVTLLQPTSPLRDEMDILSVYQAYLKNVAKAVVTVCEADHPPLWNNILPEDNSMEGFIRNGIKPRQELETYYRINGAVYMVDCRFLFEDINIFRKGCYAYIMERKKSIDIDTQFDFDIAEYLMKSADRGGYCLNNSKMLYVFSNYCRRTGVGHMRRCA